MTTSALPTVHPTDMTGTSPNNLILNETNTLKPNRVRSFTPIFSPFFSDSVVVFDVAVPNVPLTKNVDYYCVDVLGVLSAQAEKEICSTIIIVNPSVSQDVMYNYQTLGGQYTSLYTNISNLLNSIASKTDQVLFQNIIDSPDSYNPTEHLHAIGDGVGFEYLIEAINNISNTIALGNQLQSGQVQDYIDNQMLALKTYTDSEIATSINNVTNAVANIQAVLDNTVGTNLQLTNLISSANNAITLLTNATGVQSSMISKASAINISP